MKILFDGFRVYITVEKIYMDKLRGLCGVFNYKTIDDLTSIDNAVEKNIEAFANGYIINSGCTVPQKIDACKSTISVKKLKFLRKLNF